MVRNKWRKMYDEKVHDLLGMSYTTAKSRLERLMLLHAYRKLGMGNCYQCGYEILDVDDMTVEHVKPWGGNVAKNIPPNVDLHWDLDNLRLSHHFCNCSAASGGSGKYPYVGVHPYFDKRHNPPYEYVRAMINYDGSPSITLGYYNTPEEAAMAYDLAIMVFRKGIGRLNFKDKREEYKKILEDQNIKIEEFNSRKAKSLVKILKEGFKGVI